MNAAAVRLESGDGRGDVRRLGVVDEAHAVDLGDDLEAVREPAKALESGPDRAGLQAHRRRRRDGRQRVAPAVGPGKREVGRVDQCRGRLGVDANGLAPQPAPLERRLTRVVDREILWDLAREDPQLRLGVVIEAPVAVEVVGGDVQEHRALRGEGARVLQLEARALADHRRLGIGLAGYGGQRGTDVAGDDDGLLRLAPQVAEELGHGRLAVRPGHPDEGVGKAPPAELELADHRDAPVASGRDHRSLARHARALDHAARLVEQSNSVTIQVNFDARLAQPFRARRGAGVGAADGLALPRKEPRRRLSGAREPDHQVRAAG